MHPDCPSGPCLLPAERHTGSTEKGASGSRRGPDRGSKWFHQGCIHRSVWASKEKDTHTRVSGPLCVPAAGTDSGLEKGADRGGSVPSWKEAWFGSPAVSRPCPVHTGSAGPGRKGCLRQGRGPERSSSWPGGDCLPPAPAPTLLSHLSFLERAGQGLGPIPLASDS